MGTFMVAATAVAFATGLLCLNAWLLMWAWNLIAVWFHLPLINWSVALAGIIIVGSLRGAFNGFPKRESE